MSSLWKGFDWNFIIASDHQQAIPNRTQKFIFSRDSDMRSQSQAKALT